MSALPQSSSAVLRDLHVDVWHAHAMAPASTRVLATGDALLDAQLPGGGWPLGGMTELLQETGAHHEWRLLLPALARSGVGGVVLIGADPTPFAPALAAQGLSPQRLLWIKAGAGGMRLWSAEQALRCADVDAVLLWLTGSAAAPNPGLASAPRSQVRSDQLRRLQMAAAEHDKLLFVMRPRQHRHEASPAALRLVLSTQDDGDSDDLKVELLKRRGPPLEHALTLRARTLPMQLLMAACR